MTEKTLHQLYTEHSGKVSDKWSVYLTEYDRIFNEYRDKSVHLLEIGIQNGGSLEIWSKFFPGAQKLVGCDINPDCAQLTFEDPRIAVVVGDANTDAVQTAVLQHASEFDVIIDDGSHRSSDIVKSFARYFPALAEGGVYVAEDLHCSYWQEFEGGLFDPFSSITFFKRLADILSYEHWGINKKRTDILNGFFAKYGFEIDEEVLEHIHSVEFVNSICIIKKQLPVQNSLGTRFIAGSLESVVSGHLQLHASQPQPPIQDSNRWTSRDIPPDEEFLLRFTEFTAHEGPIADLNQSLTEHESQIAGLHQTVEEHESQIVDLHQTVTEHESQIVDLHQAVAEHDGPIANFNQSLTGHESQIAGLHQAVAEQESLIAGIHQAVADCNGQIANLNLVMSERDNQIAALHTSTSWRVTLPFRIASHQVKRARRVAELAMPAIRHGGGIKNTFRKALVMYQKEGLQGIKRGFRLVAASQMPSDAKDINPAYRQMVKHPAEELLAPRILIVAEMSIAQCKKYRVQQKHDMFESLGFDCTTLSWNDTQACLNALQTHSLVIFYRVPAFPNVVSIINEAKRLRLPTLWEVDDFIFDKEVLSKSKTLAALDRTTFDQLLEGADLYRNAMLLCGKGIASTTGLASAMKMAGLSEVHVIENALDQHTLEVAAKVCHNHTLHHNGILRIVYGSGTNTHNIDFQEAAPAIVKILEKFPNVRFRLIGTLDLPEIFSGFEEQVERLPTCSYEEYLSNLAECDISIAPLESYIFNDSKSNIKYLEASIVKVPSVCSPRAAFSLAIAHGENGFLCETVNEWEAALTILVTDAAKRAHVSEAAYISVMRHYAPKSIAQQQVAPLLARHARNPDTLRVLSVNCYYYPRSFGGATIVAEEVNKRINALDGFEVHVFTTLPSSVTPPYTTKRYEADGINIYGVGLPDRLDEKAQFENPEIVSAFAEVLALVQPDIVHFHSIQGIGISVVDLCAQKGIKYIVTLHDAWWLCGRQFMIDKQGKYCGQKKIDLGVCASCVENNIVNLHRNKRLITGLRNASALLAPSRFFADFHIANGFDNVQINKNGIVKPASALRFRQKGDLRFGYVGGNTEIKGVHLIKKVFSDLPGCNVKLVLVDNALNLGFASYHQEDVVGIPNVEIVPAYTQGNIDEFFSSIDVLLFPTQWKESFGLTVREALARNVWVITTDAGGVVEDIVPGRNGYIVPFSDTGEALKQAVIDTLKHFKRIRPGEEVALGALNITFFEDQAQELALILKRVDASDSVRVAQVR